MPSVRSYGVNKTANVNKTASVNKAPRQMITGIGMVAVVALSATPGATLAVTAQPHAPERAVPSSPVTLAQSTPITGYFLFVNSTIGNDAGDGSQRFPLRTITRALQQAQPNTVIVLSAGTYSAETGETFPILLKPGVTLQGDTASRGRGIVIRGGGDFVSPISTRQNITMLGANQAVISGVTLTNPNPRGYALWIESSNPTVVGNTFSNSTHDGISVTGNGAPLIQGNTFVQNGANGITVYGTAQPQIRENVFDRTGFGINLAQRSAPMIVSNRIVNNQDGVVVQGDAQPILRGNTIEGNQRDGLVAIARSLPNLGTPTEPGQNTFRNNGRYDVNTSAATQSIAAWGNELTRDRIHGSLNLAGQPVANSGASPLANRPSPPSTPQSTAAIAAATTPPRPTNPSGSFAAFPSLQPATPIAAPANPATPTAPTAQPTRPERLPLLTQLNQGRTNPPQSAPVATGSAFPTPNLSASTPGIAPGAIEIPVPPPSIGGGRPPITQSTPTARTTTQPTPSNSVREVAVQRNQFPNQPQPIARASAPAAAIEIPVPPPQSSNLVSPPAQLVAPRTLATSTRPGNVLPVPNGNAPLGNIGDMPTVMVSRNPLQRRDNVPLPAPNRAAALGLRYRVVVEAEDETTQSIVRSLIPGAFRTQANGRVLMQAGAYSDRANADETVRWLSGNGLRAIVQRLE